ncbi:hypothetical protein F4803DRAFT_296960 [Xylaria telfairii]|nr:hypothetical protein F4803DRAFT_296960 [Xylaria telfairii]
MSQLWGLVRSIVFGASNPTHNGNSFDPARDIASLAGKVVLITGAAGDLGRQTAIELTRYGRPARIYVADLPRDEQAKTNIVERIKREARTGEAMLEQIDSTEIRFLDLDLASFDSIRRCASDFLAMEERLDLLILNAGTFRTRPGTTMEGYELHFGINYLGHALLCQLCLPLMTQIAQKQPSSDFRIVAVSSEGHMAAPPGGIQFDKLKSDCANMTVLQRYGQSKIALIGFTRELASRYPLIKVAAVHPGRINTGVTATFIKESLLFRLIALAPFFFVERSLGVRNHLWAATSPDVVSGKYYVPVGVPDKENKMARDTDLSKRLWQWTNDELTTTHLPSK